MHPFSIALGSLVEDSVQYFDLVRLTTPDYTKASYIVVGRKSIYFLTKELELTFDKIAFDDLKSLHLRGVDTLIIKFGSQPSEWTIVINDRKQLLDSLLASYKTRSLLSFKNINLPVFKIEEASDLDVENGTISFLNAKKTNFSGYYFYILNDFQDATFMHGTILNMKSDSISMKLQIMKPKLIYKNQINDLSDIESHIIPVLEGFRKRYGNVTILDRGVFNKKMNLNDDISCWIGYFIYAKTETSLLAYYYLRRLYIPPLLDSYQSIIFEFTCENTVKNFKSFFNRTLYPPDSITSNKQQFWFTDVIQANMDLLLYDYSFYSRVSRLLSLKVTYHSLINGFSSALIDLLVKGGSVFDIDITSHKNDIVREWNEYINIIKLSIPGLSNQNIDGKDAAMTRMRAFNKSLALHLAHAIDKGNKFGVAVIGQIIPTNTNLNQKSIEEILNYFCHASDRKLSNDYSQNTLNKIFEICNLPDLWHVKCQLQMEISNLAFNSYPFHCLLESGYIFSKMPSTEAFVELLSAFMIVCDLDMKLTITSRLLQTYTTFDSVLLPIVSPITRLLNKDISRKLTMQLLILTTNSTCTNEDFKEEFIRNGIAEILPRILINHDSAIVAAALKSMLNLTKKNDHIHAFISSGACKVVSELFSSRENICNLSDASAVIGQICNCNVAKAHLFAGCAEKISNILAEGNADHRIIFALSQLASCNFYNKYIIGVKVFPIVANLLDSDDPLLFGNSLRLILELAHCPQFLAMEEMGCALKAVDRFSEDKRFAELISKLKYVISTSTIGGESNLYL